MGHSLLIGVFKVYNLPPHDVLAIRQALVGEWQALPQNSIVCQTDAETVLTLGVSIPAIDLTINSVILVESVKVMFAIALIRLCCGAGCSLSYVKKYIFAKFLFCHNCLIKRNDSTKHDYNLE